MSRITSCSRSPCLLTSTLSMRGNQRIDTVCVTGYPGCVSLSRPESAPRCRSYAIVRDEHGRRSRVNASPLVGCLYAELNPDTLRDDHQIAIMEAACFQRAERRDAAGHPITENGTSRQPLHPENARARLTTDANYRFRAASHFGASRSSGAWLMARAEFWHRRIGNEPNSFCRNCILVVHRCAARPPR